jgi:hypothetical protein
VKAPPPPGRLDSYHDAVERARHDFEMYRQRRRIRNRLIIVLAIWFTVIGALAFFTLGG